MMTEELGLQVDDDGASTIRDGFLMFLAFGIFGSFPLIGYVVSFVHCITPQQHSFWDSCD